ncbi:hypothetical protein L6R50_25730 [Myxococcota bacterium]|nr:hypothetical protein [Myxococcota bacterium]
MRSARHPAPARASVLIAVLMTLAAPARAAGIGECFDVDASNADGAQVRGVAQELLVAVREVDTARAFALASGWFNRTIDTAALRTVFQQALYHGYAPETLDRVRMVRVRPSAKDGRYDVECGSHAEEKGYFTYSSRFPGEQIVFFGEGPEHANPEERAQINAVFVREGGLWKPLNVFLNAATLQGRDARAYLELGREAERRGKPRIAWFQYRTAREISFISGHLQTGPWNAATAAQQALKVYDVPNRSPTPWWSRRGGSIIVYHLDTYESSGRLGLLVEYVSKDPEDLEQVGKEANALMGYIASHFPEYAEFFDAAYFSPLEETPELGEPTEPRPVTVRPFPGGRRSAEPASSPR